MRVGYAAQHRVGHGLHGIERQRPLGGRASLRGARLRRDMAAGRPHHQRIRELRMRLGVAGGPLDGLPEKLLGFGVRLPRALPMGGETPEHHRVRFGVRWPT
jgi:hypothetical protein